MLRWKAARSFVNRRIGWLESAHVKYAMTPLPMAKMVEWSQEYRTFSYPDALEFSTPSEEYAEMIYGD